VETESTERDHLRVSAHVLVQLGAELVTDVEQAILECVKNAYDADSDGCRVEIDTRAENVFTEMDAASVLWRHRLETDTVSVRFLDPESEEPLVEEFPKSPDDQVVRELTCKGRITISDNGVGIDPKRIKSSWLMISGSMKRNVSDGPKETTPRGRTPLGDKGLGRLGTMKLGDVLQVESAVDAESSVAVARFRWRDCDSAESVDQVPVESTTRRNSERLKGTRVSILGLNDLSHWRRQGRVEEIAQSLAKLVSPFEATTTFPVVITLDGREHSLMAVTNQVLNQAVAEFSFDWKTGDDQERVLVCTARFKKSLFGETRKPDSKIRYDMVFADGTGQEFRDFLEKFAKTKGYKKTAKSDPWFIELQREVRWTDLLLDGQSLVDPGDFSGAFYFFHLDTMEKSAPTGLSITRELVKQMSGISILRDGFQVRSRNDWLGLAAAMTAGSTYHMRVNNTLGYFALTGANNYVLTEKSDREGFVEDAAYRGFFAIAAACKKFANDSLEGVRRGFDAFSKSRMTTSSGDGVAITPDSAVSHVSTTLDAANSFQQQAGAAVNAILTQIEDMEASGLSLQESSRDTLEVAKRALRNVAALHSTVKSSAASEALALIKQEIHDQREQLLSMVESAAVGLSARGLAHELRTHLGEIRHRLTQISKRVNPKTEDGQEVQRHVQAIRASCSSIMSAASMIDPMLPRSRALKDTFKVSEFLREYVKHREYIFEREDISVSVRKLEDIELHVNRARMLQVLDNLVSNSRYWLKRDELARTLAGPKSISLECTSTGYVVSDSGPGIDPHYESSLFELFVTSKPERDSGQGLGLFICRQLLAVDGCRIELRPDRNERGRLYKFEVDLSAVKRG
jgi:signal transduction histidine kinase